MSDTSGRKTDAATADDRAALTVTAFDRRRVGRGAVVGKAIRVARPLAVHVLLPPQGRAG